MDNCYVDIPSACDSQTAISCTNLAADTKPACCPRLTRCVSDREMSENVRCEIAYSDLTQLAHTVADTPSLFPTRTLLSTSSASSSTNQSSSSYTRPAIPNSTIVAIDTTGVSRDPTPSRISRSGIVGIVVSVVVVVELCVSGTYFVVRRRLMAKYQPSNVSSPDTRNESNIKLGSDANGRAEVAELAGSSCGLHELDGTGQLR